MKVHIGERGDEIEQHAEADRIGRHQPPVAQMPEHLQCGGGKAAGAVEIALPRQRHRDNDGGNEREQRYDLECRAPSDHVGQNAGDKAPTETADRRARDVKPSDAGHVGRRPLVADIGDGHGENRREQQSLKKAPGDEHGHVGRESGPGHGHGDRQHGRCDNALSAENVGHGRVRVPQYERPVGANVIDVLIAVDIDHLRPAAKGDDRRLDADGAIGPHRA